MILLAVILLRPESTSFIGREAYSIIRLAETPAAWDPLSYGGRFAAYTWGTALLVSLKPDILGLSLPPLAGVISFLLLWGLLRKFRVEENTRRLSLAIFMLSPPFIFLFTTLNNYFMAILLSLLGFYYFTKNNKIASAVPFILLPLFNLPIAVIAMILFFIFTFISKKQEPFWLVFVCTAIITTAYYLTLVKYAGSPEKLLFAIDELGIRSHLQYLFSDLNGKFGLSVFGAMLALLGILYGWKKKYSDTGIFFSISALIILMAFMKHAIFFMNIFVSALAAYALNTIIKQGWQSRTMKNFTVLVIVCGLLFSSISFISRHIESEPSEGIISSLDYLKEKQQGTAFSHYTRGFWLEYAGQKTVMDENFAFAPNVNERHLDSERLLETRSFDEAMQIISKYDIKYIWLDEQLRKQIWESDEEGLQFLLKYSNNFTDISQNQQVQIWEIKS